jgi:Na+/H+ antiporter NhaC
MTAKRAIVFFTLFLLLSAVSSPALAQDASPAGAASWVSILPPLLAIVLALLLRQVIPALMAGVLLGAWAINGFGWIGLWLALLQSFQVYILNAFADPDRGAIILFSLMIGGMVGIISRNGGMVGVVNLIVNWADSARRACLATAGMGIAVFFDDYANTLVVGNTMRPVTDSMRVSRAKLAYIVDSTAAPVACIALVTTWIGYEVGLIGESIANLSDLNEEAYLLFLSTIPYSFYPLLTIMFVFMVASSGKDFGPMLQAEKLARLQDPGTQEQVDSSIASVLAGSVWGDHCSPISDTTILSSMASGCDHIEHVRTQIPYALLVGFMALGTGILPTAYGMPWWMALLTGAGLLFLVLHLRGESAVADSAK